MAQTLVFCTSLIAFAMYFETTLVVSSNYYEIWSQLAYSVFFDQAVPNYEVYSFASLLDHNMLWFYKTSSLHSCKIHFHVNAQTWVFCTILRAFTMYLKPLGHVFGVMTLWWLFIYPCICLFFFWYNFLYLALLK